MLDSGSVHNLWLPFVGDAPIRTKNLEYPGFVTGFYNKMNIVKPVRVTLRQKEVIEAMNALFRGRY